MKYKLVYGLFGLSCDGTLYTPFGRKIIKLPKTVAFKLHNWLCGNVSYIGMKNTKLLFSRLRQIKMKEEMK